ncbi:methyl-accepting chemotaxis protein [Jannaschia sp. M317]|uniref:methyl-accepting chemotaxis protein n=1 Tax=Jannaschia sp. M317 TaxID=2867011 RepID=UPI0021A2FE73|nr:methyl-accepting chemotaxis protein [Jannaschia sp. M317]UWQ17504.1 hypothetical protein K3551_16765 [Jannaschia sp. M317]
MTRQNPARLISDLLDRIIANARCVNAASRKRSEMNATLLEEARNVRDRVSAVQDGQAMLDSYFEGVSERLSVQSQEAHVLGDRVTEMRGHVEALLADEAGLKYALVAVDGHARSVSNIARMARLLAINASVEAARAGEAGRGFSVVAREMQALSEQSSERARMIDGLVADLTAQLEAMRLRLTRSTVPLDALGQATGKIRDTIGHAQVAASAAQDTASQSRRVVLNETETLRGFLDRLTEIEIQNQEAVRGSGENGVLGGRALALAQALIVELDTREGAGVRAQA